MFSSWPFSGNFKKLLKKKKEEKIKAKEAEGKKNNIDQSRNQWKWADNFLKICKTNLVLRGKELRNLIQP